MQIKLTERPEVESKGKYNVLKLSYEQDGSKKNKDVVSFGDSKPCYDALMKAAAGEVYEIKVVKDGKYWNWVGASLADVSSSPSRGSSAKATTGTWETPEERAKKQVYIIRQSSLATAASLAVNKDASIDDVIEVARKFEKYVLGIDEPGEIT